MGDPKGRADGCPDSPARIQPAESCSACPFAQLPPEITAAILSHVYPEDRLNATLVCKNWRDLARALNVGALSLSVTQYVINAKYEEQPWNGTADDPMPMGINVYVHPDPQFGAKFSGFFDLSGPVEPFNDGAKPAGQTSDLWPRDAMDTAIQGVRAWAKTITQIEITISELLQISAAIGREETYEFVMRLCDVLVNAPIMSLSINYGDAILTADEKPLGMMVVGVLIQSFASRVRKVAIKGEFMRIPEWERHFWGGFSHLDEVSLDGADLPRSTEPHPFYHTIKRFTLARHREPNPQTITDFLRKVPNVEVFRLREYVSGQGRSMSLGGLEGNRHLTEIELDYVAANVVFIPPIPSLRKFTAYECGGVNIDSVARCENLEDVKLWCILDPPVFPSFRSRKLKSAHFIYQPMPNLEPWAVDTLAENGESLETLTVEAVRINRVLFRELKKLKALKIDTGTEIAGGEIPLADMPNLRTLRCTSVPSLQSLGPPIPDTNQITGIDVGACDELSDISALSGCKSIRQVFFHGNIKTAGVSLKNMDSVRLLSFYNTHVTSVRVHNCPHLEEISISQMFNQDLREVEVTGCPNLAVLFTGNFPLENVKHDGVPALTNIDFAKPCFEMPPIDPSYVYPS